jgi:hypothetical protein
MALGEVALGEISYIVSKRYDVGSPNDVSPNDVSLKIGYFFKSWKNCRFQVSLAKALEAAVQDISVS